MSHVQVLRDRYAAFAAGDVPAVLAAFTDSIEWREAESNPYQPSGEPWRGPQAVLENLFVRLGSDWDRFSATPLRFHDAAGNVVVEGRYAGRSLATDAELDAQFCHVWTLRDGRITHFQQYTDTAQLCAVMGVGDAR